MAAVSFRNIYKSFGAVKVIEGVSIDVADGEFVVILDADLEYDPGEYGGLVRPLIEESAAKYAKENNITQRDCAKEST